MTGRIHSLQSMGTVDGPGLRAVVFMQGCPLRCIYCQNPDTWEYDKGQEIEPDELGKRILRLYPYIKNGGVTYSGGEPCMQSGFLLELSKILKKRNLHIALDTCGQIMNPLVEELLEYVDLVLLDVKMVTSSDYLRYTRGRLEDTMAFLEKLEVMEKDTWIRHVVVPGINDTAQNIKLLAELTKDFKCIKKTEFLPFKKICMEKYEALGLDFPLKDTPQMNDKELADLIKQNI